MLTARAVGAAPTDPDNLRIDLHLERYQVLLTSGQSVTLGPDHQSGDLCLDLLERHNLLHMNEQHFAPLRADASRLASL